jgi:cell shape-determining protein MreC
MYIHELMERIQVDIFHKEAMINRKLENHQELSKSIEADKAELKEMKDFAERLRKYEALENKINVLCHEASNI